MDSLLATLGTGTRIRILEILLSSSSSDGLTHAALRAKLEIPGPALTREIRPLKDIGLLATNPGPRKDQPLYTVRQPNLVRDLLALSAKLDAILTRESALLLHAEAELKEERARKLSAPRDEGSADSEEDEPR